MSKFTQFFNYAPKILVQKFTVTMGTYVDGSAYWTLGSAKIIDSVSSTDGSAYLFAPDGPAARFCFVNLGRAVNPNKTFLNYSHSGHQSNGNQLAQVRLYNWNTGSSTAGYPSSLDTEAYQVQLYQRGLWPKSTFGSEAPEITVEVIEYL
jgi:hypothetical protein